MRELSVVALVLGCAPAVHSVFHATDASYVPKPGPTPRVYLEAKHVDFPRSQLRSVGIIEVTVPKKHGMERAIELAAAKGRELGCWLVIEHSTFEKLAVSLAFDARVSLAHGPPSAAPAARVPAKLTAEFYCIVKIWSTRERADDLRVEAEQRDVIRHFGPAAM